MTLAFNMQGDVLVATICGEVSADEAVLRFKEIFSFAARNDLRKILVNCLKVTGVLSTTERYNLGVTALGHLVSLNIKPRIAIVGTAPTVDGFGLRVAANRGADGALFATSQDAMDWLAANSSGHSFGS